MLALRYRTPWPDIPAHTIQLAAGVLHSHSLMCNFVMVHDACVETARLYLSTGAYSIQPALRDDAACVFFNMLGKDP